MGKLDELNFDEPETCPNCGQFVGQESTCPNCGALLYDEDEDLNVFDEESDVQ
jgi:predicted  nucleic acid-binding Zn-ribbon protein